MVRHLHDVGAQLGVPGEELPLGLRLHVTEDDKAGLLRDQALKFLLEPRHVTPAVLFLLGTASSAITGQEIVVDGGKFMG